MPTHDTPADNFCMAPWVNIHVGLSENLQPCCASAGVKATLAQLPMYLDNHNQDLMTVKQQFLQGKTPSACQGCQERDWYSQFVQQAPTGITDFTMLSLDLRWSTACQLTCMYCNAAQSSSWAAIQKLPTIIPIGNRIHDREVLIDLIDEHKAIIQRVSLLGGEPLLIKENVRVLELLGSEIEVSVFTGLNVDLQTNPVYRLLVDMPNVYWTISMENVGSKFEFVRRGASWNKQVQNLDLLLAENRSRYTVTFQSQYCVYSATSVTELYDFVQDRDIKIHWNWLHVPEELDFANFPDYLKSMAMEQLQSIKLGANKFSYQPQVDDMIDRLVRSLGQGHRDYVSRCRQWHQDIETRYFNGRHDFVSLWPELAN